MEPVFLSGLAFEPGQQSHISTIADAVGDIALDVLSKNGVEHFLSSETGIEKLVGNSLKKTIQNSEIDPVKINAILVCSESFGLNPSRTTQFAAVFTELGLGNTPVYGLTLGGCVGFISAIEFARALLGNNGLENIAIITVDACASPESRLAPYNVSLFSDAAASCLVSQAIDRPSIEIVGIGQFTDLEVSTFHPVEQAPLVGMRYFEGMRKAKNIAIADADVGADEVKLILPTLTRLDFMDAIFTRLGFLSQNIFTETLSSFSHCFGSDPIISLIHSAKWREQRKISPNEPFMVMGLDPHQWGSLIMRDCI